MPKVAVQENGLLFLRLSDIRLSHNLTIVYFKVYPSFSQFFKNTVLKLRPTCMNPAHIQMAFFSRKVVHTTQYVT